MASTAFNYDDIAAKFGADKRKDLVDMARTAETSERYEDMCAFMKNLVLHVAQSEPLTIEERNLLSVAYKNVIGARRAAWRVLGADENKNNEIITVYRAQVENELETISKEVLNLIESTLIPKVGSDAEPHVFYLKMAGDYYRYLAEFIAGKNYAESADKNYKAAMDVASQENGLNPTHPIRLGLALNYSVCLYEIAKKPKEACDLAKKAFDEAISKLDQLDEGSYKDSTLIMQLLRDNLTLWTSEGDEED